MRSSLAWSRPRPTRARRTLPAASPRNSASTASAVPRSSASAKSRRRLLDQHEIGLQHAQERAEPDHLGRGPLPQHRLGVELGQALLQQDQLADQLIGAFGRGRGRLGRPPCGAGGAAAGENGSDLLARLVTAIDRQHEARGQQGDRRRRCGLVDPGQHVAGAKAAQQVQPDNDRKADGGSADRVAALRGQGAQHLAQNAQAGQRPWRALKQHRHDDAQPGARGRSRRCDDGPAARSRRSCCRSPA